MANKHVRGRCQYERAAHYGLVMAPGQVYQRATRVSALTAACFASRAH